MLGRSRERSSKNTLNPINFFHFGDCAGQNHNRKQNKNVSIRGMNEIKPELIIQVKHRKRSRGQINGGIPDKPVMDGIGPDDEIGQYGDQRQ